MFESSPKLLSQNRFSSGLHWAEREWIDLMEEVQRPLQPVREHIYDLYIYICKLKNLTLCILDPPAVAGHLSHSCFARATSFDA